MVWSAWLRAAHWLLVATTAAAWWTRSGYGTPHEWWGYAVLAIVVSRIGVGLFATGPARFGVFLVGPTRLRTYLLQLSAGSRLHVDGHNPLGGYMVLTMLLSLLVVCGSGWLYTTDRFWGIEWVERLHAGASDALLVLITLHLLGVSLMSWRLGENLFARMGLGVARRRSTGGTDEHTEPRE